MKASGRGGVIVNVGSSSARGGREGQGAYSASKAGIQCLTETLAIEGKDDGMQAKEQSGGGFLLLLFLFSYYIQGFTPIVLCLDEQIQNYVENYIQTK